MPILLMHVTKLKYKPKQLSHLLRLEKLKLSFVCVEVSWWDELWIIGGWKILQLGGMQQYCEAMKWHQIHKYVVSQLYNVL